jgi:hypothetical protein
MAARKRRLKAESPAQRQDNEPERVSMAPLDPVEALKGLLATPPPETEPKRRKPAKKK